MTADLTNPDNTHYPSAKAVADAITSSWGWDMLKSVYDPNNVNANAFDYDNFINTPTIPTKTSDLNNDSGFITGITSGDVTTALWYTPYNSTNPNWYVNSSIINDTAYASSWDGDTTHSPTKNAVYDKINSMDTDIGSNTSAISTINSKIPSAATPSNQLADKDYVNDGINSVTAYYITKNAQGDQWATRAELFAATTFYSWWVVRVPTKNDYTIVLADEQHDNATTRYIYNSWWEYQYTVNETALTQAQLDALNSWITAAKVNVYDWYATSKQDKLVNQTNIKSINNNSLLGSWNLTLNDVKVSATAPASPTEWMVWYDTTNDELKVYDWTNWKATGSEYSAGEWISIWSVVINWRQWPAPEWFHVPSVDEWASLETLMDNAGLSSWNDWKTNLYMPFSWHRYDDASIDVQWTEWYYWSSTPFSWTGTIAESSSYNLFIATTWNAGPREYSIRSYWLSIRCFKDTPVEIENPLTPWWDWDLITNVGLGFYIFHSPSLWVITIMSRNSWREYITIADKNLWATTVYNDWDILSEANCWKYYQWWNNYWFPWTWAITTSGTQVDASWYWPWNYYSSDTFITWYADWSSVRNPNLWWDTTWTITQDNVIKNTWVLSVNGQTWNITIETFQLAPNSPLTPKYRRYWSQAQYDALTQYYTDNPGDTVYFTI